jgi:membrane protease YdiL (CAAX protease family)
LDQFNTELNQQQNSGPNGMQPINGGQYEMPPKKIITRAALGLFIMACVTLIVQYVIEISVNAFCPEIANANWYVWAITAISIVVIGFPVYYLYMRTIPNSPKGETVRMSPVRFIKIFFICTASMYVTNMLSSLLTFFIAFLKGEKELLNPAADAIIGGNYTLALIYAVIVAPFFEELIFRKILLDKLRRFGDIPAILFTGLAFGLFHMNLSQFFYAAVLGFIFAYVTIKTNTVIYSIILHMMINLISTIMIPFVVKGNVLLSLVLILWVLVSITAGAVLLILNVKKIKLTKAVPVIKVSDYIMNPGTILYLLVCFVMIVLITLN